MPSKKMLSRLAQMGRKFSDPLPPKALMQSQAERQAALKQEVAAAYLQQYRRSQEEYEASARNSVWGTYLAPPPSPGQSALGLSGNPYAGSSGYWSGCGYNSSPPVKSLNASGYQIVLPGPEDIFIGGPWAGQTSEAVGSSSGLYDYRAERVFGRMFWIHKHLVFPEGWNHLERVVAEELLRNYANNG